MLSDVLRAIVDRIDFGGDDGAKDALLSDIEDLDEDAPVPFVPASTALDADTGTDDEDSDTKTVDGANA